MHAAPLCVVPTYACCLAARAYAPAGWELPVEQGACQALDSFAQLAAVMDGGEREP